MNRLDFYYKLLRTTENQVEKARNKRTILTILFFSLLYFLIACMVDKPTGLEILGTLLVSLVFGGIHFFVNAIVFSTLNTKSEAENKNLELIRKQIRELEQKQTD